jgi:hypothetical protein
MKEELTGRAEPRPPGDSLECALPAFIVSNANDLIDLGDEYLSISNLPGSRCGDNRANHILS